MEICFDSTIYSSSNEYAYIVLEDKHPLLCPWQVFQIMNSQFRSSRNKNREI